MAAPAWLLAKPFAHRGLHEAGIPENSLAAIDAALSAGFAVEIDLQLSSDGHAVVFHDACLSRLTGLKGNVADLPSRRLADLRLLDTNERIPLLGDVLDLIQGRGGLLIEIKSQSSIGLLEAEVSRLLRDYRGDFAVQAFHPKSLAWFRQHDPSVTRGQLSSGWSRSNWKTSFLGNYAMNWLSRPHFIGHDCRCLPSIAATFLRRRGLPVLAWTVKSPAERAAVLPYADNIIFEQFRPD